MIFQTDSAAGVAANSAPGLLYVAARYLSEQPIEKWVSALTGVFIALQIVFLLRDRMQKRRGKRGEK